MLRAVTSADIITSTWANKPSSAAATGLYLFTDIGSSGTLMRYANSRWRPLAGQAQLAALGAAVTGITNSETIVLQTLIPAGAWQQYDKVRIGIAGNKSGATDTAQMSVRVGTAGTTADTVITGLSTFTLAAGANVTYGLEFEIKLLAATSAQKVGVNNASSSSYSGANSGTQAPATTITDASVNALYVSVGVLSSGTTNTVSVLDSYIQLLTP